MPAAPTGVLSDLDRVLLDADSIRARVTEMARQIEADYAGKVVTVVVLMDGALFFVADLLRQINLPMRIVTLGASSYHGGMESAGKVKLNWPAGVEFAGLDVLLLDDILDTGLTLHALQERLLSEEPASLKTGVLLDKKRPREHAVPLEYCGFEIGDEFVVGYGMDYQGRFRNLPCIGILKL
jgi:hypoxanthine phosphoribosyltransferase